MFKSHDSIIHYKIINGLKMYHWSFNSRSQYQNYILNTLNVPGVPGIDNLRKIIIKYYLEEYFGIDIQMKVLDFEF